MLDNFKQNDYDATFSDIPDYGSLEDKCFDFNDLGTPEEDYPQNIEEEEYFYIDMNQEDPCDAYERHLAELKIEASQNSTHTPSTAEEQGIGSTNYHLASNSKHLHGSKLLHSIRDV